jgi:hypothetical protein
MSVGFYPSNILSAEGEWLRFNGTALRVLMEGMTHHSQLLASSLLSKNQPKEFN